MFPTAIALEVNTDSVGVLKIANTVKGLSLIHDETDLIIYAATSKMVAYSFEERTLRVTGTLNDIQRVSRIHNLRFENASHNHKGMPQRDNTEPETDSLWKRIAKWLTT